MRPGLVWLAIVDLGRAWLRPSLAALAIGVAVLALAFFGRQLGLRQAELGAAYERAGAASFVVELSGLLDSDIDPLANTMRALPKILSVEAPFNGLALGVVADTSFLVFRNDRQQEYLGARTNVVGVDPTFDLAREYFVDFHDINPGAPHRVIGIPLLSGSAKPQALGDSDILVPSDVTDYVGVAPGAGAVVELAYLRASPPIIQRVEGLRLAGTVEVAGPDRGRFDPFWRFVARGQEVLTVRRPDTTDAFRTTLPILLNSTVVREFLTFVEQELARRGIAPPVPLGRTAVTVTATSLRDVGVAEAAISSLLEQRGLQMACAVPHEAGFCLRVPERNNFRAALNQQNKLVKGGSYFIALLTTLLAIGGDALQVQAVLARWHEYGVLQAVGFSRAQVLGYHALQFLIIFVGAIAVAGILSLVIPSVFAGSVRSFVSASAVALAAAGLAGLSVVLWPLSRPVAELLRQSA